MDRTKHNFIHECIALAYEQKYRNINYHNSEQKNERVNAEVQGGNVLE